MLKSSQYANTQNSNKRTICPKGAHNVMMSFINTGNGGVFTTFSGIVTLLPRLDDVIGMRVCSMLINCPTGFTFTGGWQWVLQSQFLAQVLARDPYYVAASTSADVPLTVQAQPISSIIAVAQIASSTGFASNQTAQSSLYELDHYLPFAGPTPIDRYDWQVAPLNGTWTFTGAYTIEINIEFYHECGCSGSTTKTDIVMSY